MKKIFVVLLVLIATTAGAQNKDYLITLNGLGQIKLGMSQDELEKVLNKKVPLTNPTDTISGSWVDSAIVRYKNIDVELKFVRSYYAERTFRMIITWMKASSPLCKTASGIGIGSGKLQVIAAYDGYYISINPEFLSEDRTVKSKTHSWISVRRHDEGDTILFNLVNKKVVSFEIFPVYDDEE